ncbi:hypothetical protein PF001_g11072 [Phytophthora fragariae]|uniref:Uncharacterized protein n=1 Tax=Phytophthora fragariae TaxID=53985 RepID=A0A6A4DHN1_9STRA|nr:hypothetical protein PF001_g11072 [Phytophthora fragariae]KAE9332142.1 hypothetical protein PF008_g15085 [Phytophthora fragariae]
MEGYLPGLCGIKYVADKKSGHDVVCFTKDFSAPLAKDQALNHQLQALTTKKLELTLFQGQQNIEIPQASLIFHR